MQTDLTALSWQMGVMEKGQRAECAGGGSNDSPEFDFIRVHPGKTNEPTGFTCRELVKGY